MIAILLAVAVASAQGKPASQTAPPRSQPQLLKDWALARCIARGASGPFAQDGAISAAALLERGQYGIEAYEAVEALVGVQLAKRYGGSVRGEYVTLKCLDLYHGAELDRLTRRQKVSPVR